MNTSLATVQATAPAQARFSSELFTRFMDYCDVKDSTVQGYTVAIRHFMAWITAQQITQPTREDVKAYKDHLATGSSEKGKPYAATTQARYFRACKLFFKWCAAEGLYPNIADNLKPAKARMDVHHRDALTGDDMRGLLEGMARDDETQKRDYAIMLLCVTCGFRIVEIQRANIGDLQTIRGQAVLFIQGKGHDEKDAYKKIVPAVYDAIRDYLATRQGWKKSDPLFTSTSNRAKGERITVPSISRIVKNIFVGAGFDSSRITAHSLRHTSVTLALEAGLSLQQAQAHARHASPATTEIYAHNIDQEKEQPEMAVYNQIYGIKAPDDFAQLFAALSPAAQAATIAFMKAQQKIAG